MRKRSPKKRKRDEEAAEAYADFVANFEGGGGGSSKTFLKAGTETEKTNRYAPVKKTIKGASPPPSPKETVKSKALPGKKVSNLELFMEQIKKSQEEKEEKKNAKKLGTSVKEPPKDTTHLSQSISHHSLPQPLGSIGSFPIALSSMPEEKDGKGSFDTGDPTTTNLYVGNMSPQMTEDILCKEFGCFGPLASVKIMWPRTEEEKSRGRMCGFVAFMQRPDGEKAIRALNGKEIIGFEIKVGWGKAVQVPPRPYYVHTAPVVQETGLPFNATPKSGGLYGSVAPPSSATGGANTKIINATVNVEIPKDRTERQIIHRMIEFVIQEGPLFEALIMQRSANDPKFLFLFQNTSAQHIYYRWKLFSILQAEKPDKWRLEPFRMFTGGSMWQPPTPDQLEKEEIDKGHLSATDRDRLEDKLRNLTAEREAIADSMVFCLTHADAAEEVVECIQESLGILETPIGIKIARLFLVSDILHNSSNKGIRNASYFRRGLESKLPDVFTHLNLAYKAISGRLRAEQFRKQVMNCIHAWKEWSIFTPDYFTNLEDIFLGLNKYAPAPVAPAARSYPEEDGDIDGVPMNEDDDEDVDGVPLTLPVGGLVSTFAPVLPPVQPAVTAPIIPRSKWDDV